MNDLIVFFHIPKTAGMSLTYMFLREYGEDKIVRITKRPRVSWAMTPKEYYMLLFEERSLIRFLTGHIVSKKMIELNKERIVKKIVFVREPASHIISLYNQYVRMMQDRSYMKYYYLSKIVSPLYANEVMPFEFWYKFVKNPQTCHFKWRYFLGKRGWQIKRSDIGDIIKEISEFFFVGITENFEKDVRLLMKKLSIDVCDIEKKNVVGMDYKKYIDLDSGLRERLNKENLFDSMLYEEAVKINQNIKTG